MEGKKRQAGENRPSDTQIACWALTDQDDKQVKDASVICAKEKSVTVNTDFLDEKIKELAEKGHAEHHHHHTNEEHHNADGSTIDVLSKLIIHLGVPQDKSASMRECIIITLTKNIEDSLTQRENTGDITVNDRRALTASFGACKNEIPIDVCYHEACVKALTSAKAGVF